MKKLFVILALIPLLVSCSWFHKPTDHITVYDTVKIVVHNTVTDTVVIIHHNTVNDTVFKTVIDTAGIVYAGRRDTIAIFRGLVVFFGSWSDSVSHKDNMRYFTYEVFNYGSEDYVPSPTKYLKVIFDLEINKVIKYTDTTKIQGIKAGYSRKFVAKFPVAWFTSGTLPATWNYNGLDLPYHYRLKMVDEKNMGKDAWYPRPINEALPVKKYRDVEKDTVMYWVRPIIVDVPTLVKRPVYAYQDSLIFIDNILGCKVYSHIFFGGNKIYSFIADTCTKRLYSGTGMTDNQTNGITAMVIKAFKKDVDTATLKIYVNDTIVDHMRFDHRDSVYVYLLTKSFKNIKSISFSSLYNVTVQAVLLNNLDVLSQPITITGSVTKINTGAYNFVPVKSSGLLANWKFNNNANDLTGKYNATNFGVYSTDKAEGTASTSFQNSAYYVDCGVIPLPNQFMFTGWFMTYNEQATSRPLFGNTKYPGINGYIAYIDEVNKGLIFATGNGVNGTNAKSMNVTWARGEWVFFALEIDRTANTCRFHLKSSAYTTNSNTMLANFPVTGKLLLGRDASGSQAWCYLDDFRIYNRILTPAELSTVFNKQDIAGTGSTTENKIKITLP